MSYKVKLQSFEGPFDLLVYLIENAQMNIYDIEISSITAQYLAHIQAMREMDIAVSTDFMVLASSLIEIKSKMILPRMSAEGTPSLEEDPRRELVAKLLEYKKYKNAAEILRSQEEAAADVFQKPQEDISQFLANPDEYLSLDVRQLASAFSAFLQRKSRIEAVRRHYTRVERERFSVESRMRHIVRAIRSRAGRIFSFRELIVNKRDRYDVVITFVSLLEMAKERIVRVEQRATYGDIEVAAGERIDEGEIKYEQ